MAIDPLREKLEEAADRADAAATSFFGVLTADRDTPVPVEGGATVDSMAKRIYDQVATQVDALEQSASDSLAAAAASQASATASAASAVDAKDSKDQAALEKDAAITASTNAQSSAANAQSSAAQAAASATAAASSESTVAADADRASAAADDAESEAASALASKIASAASAAQAASSATQSAISAAASLSSSNTASGFSANADNKAEQARVSSVAAAASATQAAASAASVSTAGAAAQTSANAAAASATQATAASTSANTARDQAVAAKTAAESAATSADSANTSALGHANDAEDSALASQASAASSAGYATTSQSSANASAQSAYDSLQHASASQASALASAASAQASEESKGDAEGFAASSANSASESLTSANNSAASAAQSSASATASQNSAIAAQGFSAAAQSSADAALASSNASSQSASDSANSAAASEQAATNSQTSANASQSSAAAAAQSAIDAANAAAGIDASIELAQYTIESESELISKGTLLPEGAIIFLRDAGRTFKKSGGTFAQEVATNPIRAILSYGTYAEAVAESGKLPSNQILHVESSHDRYLVDSGELTRVGPITPVSVFDGFTRSVQSKSSDAPSLYDFGAIGDGQLHLLSERFETLADAQSVYPHALSLSDSIDWAAIQAALDFAKPVAATAGVYVVNRTCVIKSRSVLLGDSPFSVTIKAAANSNCTVMMTDNFEYLFNVGGGYTQYEPLLPGAFSVGGFTIDGSRGDNYAGGITSQHEGAGILVYGVSYNIHDIVIVDTCGIGMRSICRYVDRGTPTLFPDLGVNTSIRRIDTRRTRYEGFIYEGFPDISISDVFCGMVGEASQQTVALGSSLAFPGKSIDGIVVTSHVDGSAGLSSLGTCELGLMHAWTVYEGYCMRFTGAMRLNADTLHPEGGVGGVIFEGAVHGSVKTMMTRNNVVGPHTNRPQVRISTTRPLVFNTVICQRFPNEAALNREMIVIDSGSCKIGNLHAIGGDQSGDGVIINGTATITNLFIQGCTGVNGVRRAAGLVVNQLAKNTCIGNIEIKECDIPIFWDAKNWFPPVISAGVIIKRPSSSEAMIVFGPNAVQNKFTWRKCGFFYDTGTGFRYPEFMGEVFIPSGVSTNTEYSIPHSMWRTPELTEIKLTCRTSGFSTEMPDTWYVSSVDDTSVKIIAKNTSANGVYVMVSV